MISLLVNVGVNKRPRPIRVGTQVQLVAEILKLVESGVDWRPSNAPQSQTTFMTLEIYADEAWRIIPVLRAGKRVRVGTVGFIGIDSVSAILTMLLSTDGGFAPGKLDEEGNYSIYIGEKEEEEITLST